MMFPPHPSPVQPDMSHFYNNPGYQNNPGMYGRHAPHIPANSAFLPPGLPSAHGPPPLPPTQPLMMSGWNGGFHMPPPPPPPQGPYNPLQHHHRPPSIPQQLPTNLMNFQPNRHQFNLHHTNLGNPPFQCAPPQNAFGPPQSSQFMIPPSQFPCGLETFHQGYVTAGGPFSAHHNNGPFYTNHDHSNMTNFMGPPSFMQVNSHPPMPLPQQGTPFDQFHPHKLDLSQSGFDDICGHYGITPVAFPKPLFGKINNDETVKHTVFSSVDDNDFDMGMFEHLQQQQSNELLNKDTSRGGKSHSHNPVRMTTPSACILERNTAVNFDESSEELAEIFGEKQTHNTTGTTKSRASSKSSSKRSSSTSSLFNSDDENSQYPSKDKATREVKVSKHKSLCQGIKVKQEKPSNESKHLEACDHIRPPPGFAQIKPGSGPTEDHLSKAGHIIKGILKIDIKKGSRGSSTSPHEGNTIRSMIHQPIYSNCESRLIKQEPKVKINETLSETTQVLNSANTGQTRYIQRITSHFRILFEPIPDMFGDN